MLVFHFPRLYPNWIFSLSILKYWKQYYAVFKDDDSDTCLTPGKIFITAVGAESRIQLHICRQRKGSNTAWVFSSYSYPSPSILIIQFCNMRIGKIFQNARGRKWLQCNFQQRQATLAILNKMGFNTENKEFTITGRCVWPLAMILRTMPSKGQTWKQSEIWIQETTSLVADSRVTCP